MKKIDTAHAADSALPIRFLGRSLPYRDHGEVRLLEILRQSSDRSDGSDELALQADDWPSRYHLSRSRSNLLRPFLLEPGMRVLEIGAGCGALSRYLGETGVDLIALEGSSIRAEACAERCAGLANVKVVCGALEDFHDPQGFDLVLVVGVLEYAAAAIGGDSTPESFLDLASALLRADGALILAIENQLGLKYLLGHPEDHCSEPWVGLVDYPGPSSVRTFSRRALGQLLERSGLCRQRWFFPFPDYKLPRAILSEDVYHSPGNVELVDQLVRWPTPLGTSHLPIDERRAHQTFVSAGLGPDIANSFLICATTETADPERFVAPTTRAWYFGDERRRCWRRMKRVESTATGWVVEATSLAGSDEPHRNGWLAQQASGSSPFFTGQTLEQRLRRAVHRHDLETLKTWIKRWDRFLADHEEEPREIAPHPFGDPTASRLLPAHFLDVDVSNFIVDGEQLRYIDDEWRAGSAINARLIRMRALRNLAYDTIRSQTVHPWPASTTVDELTRLLGAEIELELTDQDFERLRQAEGALYETVLGRDLDKAVEEHKYGGGLSLESFRDPRTRRFEQDLAAKGASYEERLAELQRGHETTWRAYEQEIQKLTGVIEQVEASWHERYKAASEELHGELDKAHQSSLESQRVYEEQIAVIQQAHRADGQIYEKEIERLKSQLEAASQAGEAREQRLIELDKTLRETYQAHEVDRQKYSDEIARLTTELEQRDVGIAEQKAALEQRDQQIVHLTAIIQHQAIDLENTRRRTVHLRQILDSILGSPIWRFRFFVGAVVRRLIRPIKRWLER